MWLFLNDLSFLCCVNEIFAHLRCYTAYIVSYLPTFRGNRLLDPWRRDRQGCPETSVTIYQYTVRNISEENPRRGKIDRLFALQNSIFAFIKLLHISPVWVTNSLILCILQTW